MEPVGDYGRLAVRIGLLSAVLFFAAAGSCPRAARAQDQHRLELGPEYRRFPAWEYAAAATLLAGSGLIRLLSSPPAEANMRGGWPGDEAVRDVFCGLSQDARARADFWSDLGWWVAQAFPVVVDGLLLGWLADDFNHDVGWQITAMNYEAYAVAGLLTSASHALIGRERPSGHSCEEDDGYDPLCGSRALYASFLSGHTSMAFAGAGLTCAHHQHVPLLGDTAWDVAACALTTAMAYATGMFRIIADRHYLSDIAVSALTGFAAGYFIPTFLHYRAGDAAEPASGASTLLVPSASPTPQISLGAPW